MFKRVIVFLLVAVMILSMIACGDQATTGKGGKWKIGIMTNTVSQNEEEYRAAQNVLAKYGAEHIIHMTYPDKFMDEQETTIANAVSMASDPDLKALLFVQAVPGTAAAIDKVREINPGLLIIAGVPGEDPKMIAEKADVVFQADDLSMGSTIPEQAKKQGAKVFVHYSFPRHMSYPLLAARRDLMKQKCEEIGLQFVDATAPDPTGDMGTPGAQQFILADVPSMVEKYGKDTAFFSTNCSMQVPLIKASLDEGAIYPQPCCPSPYHGFPSALGIEIPEDKKGDIDYVVSEIKKEIANKGGAGRFSTWPVPVAMMFIEAGAEYAIDYIEGNTTGKMDLAKLQEAFEEYAKVSITTMPLEENGVKYDNYQLVLLDFLNF
ncbi:DUF3798 domain-containing protein [Proteiniborus sp. MB09-C3]|uniref:DUF3798 domain-containing protein n=1 Tax=Proteiniborus sp. MB09-C3 TaxID=3050072 RepID=UPI002554B8DD|nr:DUF3798 domain-containing protein [Proteiniborus sp. MB09-C3]WIV10738.1 DUF3798 domain-containing protein [Proteiniborus sp. MB09-C3]